MLYSVLYHVCTHHCAQSKHGRRWLATFPVIQSEPVASGIQRRPQQQVGSPTTPRLRHRHRGPNAGPARPLYRTRLARLTVVGTFDRPTTRFRARRNVLPRTTPGIRNNDVRHRKKNNQRETESGGKQAKANAVITSKSKHFAVSSLCSQHAAKQASKAIKPRSLAVSVSFFYCTNSAGISSLSQSQPQYHLHLHRLTNLTVLDESRAHAARTRPASSDR